MLSDRSSTTIPVDPVGSTLWTRTSPPCAEAAAAATHAMAAVASTMRTSRVRSDGRRNAAASYVSTAGLRMVGFRVRLQLRLGLSLREQHGSRVGREPARRLQRRRLLGPREPARRESELRVPAVERFGDQLEGTPAVGGAVL